MSKEPTKRTSRSGSQKGSKGKRSSRSKKKKKTKGLMASLMAPFRKIAGLDYGEASASDEKTEIGFWKPFITVLVAIVAIAWILFSVVKMADDKAEVDLVSLDGLLANGTLVQITEKMDDLNAPVTIAHLPSRLELYRNRIRVAEHLLKHPEITEEVQTSASRSVIKSASMLMALSNAAGVGAGVDEYELFTSVERLAQHESMEIRREAHLALVVFRITSLKLKSQSPEELQLHRNNLAASLDDFLSKFPRDIWVADNLDKLSPLALNDEFDREGRLIYLNKFHSHFVKDSKFKKLAKKKNIQRLIVQYDLAKLGGYANYGFESQFPTIIEGFTSAFQDPEVDPELVTMTLGVCENFESIDEYEKSKQVMELLIGAIENKSGAGWGQAKALAGAFQNRLAMIGNQVELGELQTVFDSKPKPYNLIVYLDEAGSEIDVLRAQLGQLKVIRPAESKIVICYPPSQAEFAQEVAQFANAFDLVTVPASDSIKAMFGLQNQNFALLIADGVLVDSHISFREIAISYTR